MFIRAGDLGWSLLTGDRCSEVAVSTGLTVPHFSNDNSFVFAFFSEIVLNLSLLVCTSSKVLFNFFSEIILTLSFEE
jgi:hypothetical protein